MANQITNKRAELLREWLLACNANNESYYDFTLLECIPDGDTLDDVLFDLQDGFYDDELENMIRIYKMAKRRYSKDGWYVCGTLYMDENKAVSAMNISIPEKIYKGGKLCAENIERF